MRENFRIYSQHSGVKFRLNHLEHVYFIYVRSFVHIMWSIFKVSEQAGERVRLSNIITGHNFNGFCQFIGEL